MPLLPSRVSSGRWTRSFRATHHSLHRELKDSPDLARARSERTHHSTLLHYVGANGVEGWRQRTPKNAVRIAELLIDAGSEVDATADMYGGGCTTLGLVATSCHPRDAGLQQPLMDVLLGTRCQHRGTGRRRRRECRPDHQQLPGERTARSCGIPGEARGAARSRRGRRHRQARPRRGFLQS